MALKKFMDLSPELKSLIVKHIIRPSDLRNLCLVCKNLHEITVRQLYYEVALDLGSPNDLRLAAFLNPRNIGLKHIRVLELYLADVMDKCNQLQQAHFAIRMILEMLPEDILHKFSWIPWQPFSGDNLVLLYKKQKKLKRLEALNLDKNVIGDIQRLPNLDSAFENVRQLGLYPDSREVLDFCNMLVCKSPKVEKITLHAGFEDSDSPIPEREANDSSTGPGLITGTIFSHMQPFAKCVPLALKELTLQKISLRYCVDTFCRFIDFRSVKALRLFTCTGADAFFAQLSKSTQLPNKLDILEFKHYDNAEQDGLAALDGFLCLVTGIKELTIDLVDVKGLPAAAGIIRHRKTLKLLNVHANKMEHDCDNEIVYDYASFADICKGCKELEQISVGFPLVSVLRQRQDVFRNFENCLGELPKLVTLNITTWPNSAPSSNLPRNVYEHLLQGMAQQGFERSEAHAAGQGASSKLAIIAFGSSDKCYDREDSQNQIIFVKGKQVDPLGREKPTAIQIGWCLRKYVDAGPKSEILDFPLMRSTRPPTRDAADSDDSDA